MGQDPSDGHFLEFSSFFSIGFQKFWLRTSQIFTWVDSRIVNELGRVQKLDLVPSQAVLQPLTGFRSFRSLQTTVFSCFLDQNKFRAVFSGSRGSQTSIFSCSSLQIWAWVLSEPFIAYFRGNSAIFCVETLLLFKITVKHWYLPNWSCSKGVDSPPEILYQPLASPSFCLSHVAASSFTWPQKRDSPVSPSCPSSS